MIYFLSDAHLGSRALTSGRTRERRLVRFLDSIKHKADSVWMLGDMFDFWFEYRQVVPKGHVRFLGKLAELTDMGVEVHYFLGNHDLWCKDYLARECGVIIHREPLTVELGGRVFHLAHGDGLGDRDRKFRFLRHIFHSPFCQKAFACLHPDHAVRLGLGWACRSRLSHEAEGEPRFMGEANEPLIAYSRDYLTQHPDVSYFLYGHRHIELDFPLSDTSRLFIIGDWVDKFAYATFDGTTLALHRYIEGETQP